MPNNDAQAFVKLVREIVEQQLSERSTDAVAEVESVNDDGTLNLYVLPDRRNVVYSIKNESKYIFKAGDVCLLYLIRNKLSNSFVITRYGRGGVEKTQQSVQQSSGITNIYTYSGSPVTPEMKTLTIGGVKYNGSIPVSYPSVSTIASGQYNMSLENGVKIVAGTLLGLTVVKNGLSVDVGCCEISFTSGDGFVFESRVPITMVGMDCSAGKFNPVVASDYVISFDYEQDGLIGTVIKTN